MMKQLKLKSSHTRVIDEAAKGISTMSTRQTVILIVLVLSFCVFSQNTVNTDGEKVDDKEQGSGKVGNLADGIETIDKGVNIVNGATGAASTYKWLKTTPKNKRMADAKNALINGINAYQNTKAGLLPWIKNTTKRISEIATKANDRIKLWNTALPTMQRYWDNTKRLANQTVDVFRSFNPSDLLDIDRKWDRKMQATMDQWPIAIRAWYHYIDKFDRPYWSEFYRTVFIPDHPADCMRSTEEMSKISDDILYEGVDPVVAIPRTVLENVAGNMLDLRELDSLWNSPSKEDASKSIEDQNFELISKNLADKNQTYEDERELSSLIESERSKVSNQNTQIMQRITFMSVDLARMHMLDKEKAVAERGSFQKELALVVSGGEKSELTQKDYTVATIKAGILK